MKPTVLLYGATGHTGGFVAAEMARRGWNGVVAGRDREKLEVLAARHGMDFGSAVVENADELDALLEGADAIINAAGPFGDTSPQLIEAAIRSRVPYFDVTAEPFVALNLFEKFADPAMNSNTLVAPAFAFFGALGDLLATAVKGDWEDADEIKLGFAMDRWRPTKGTRLAGARRAGRRLVRTDGKDVVRDPAEPTPRGSWRFPEPFGEQPTIGEFSTVDVVTITRHIPVGSISTWINEAPIADLISPDPDGPAAADESGRSAQQFVIEAVVRRDSEERRGRVSGRDIYAVTAPIVCQAVSWALAGRAKRTGVATAGELFPATDFLFALSPEPLAIHLH